MLWTACSEKDEIADNKVVGFIKECDDEYDRYAYAFFLVNISEMEVAVSFVPFEHWAFFMGSCGAYVMGYGFVGHRPSFNSKSNVALMTFKWNLYKL